MIKFQIPLGSRYLHSSTIFLINEGKAIPVEVLRKECTATGKDEESISFEMDEDDLIPSLRVLGINLDD